MLQRFGFAPLRVWLIALAFMGQLAEAGENRSSDADLYWKPIGSFLLPGMSQWIDGEYTRAGVYTGLGVAGYASSAHIAARHDYDFETLRDTDAFERVKEDRNFRFSILSFQTGKLMGELSLYDSFRTQIKSRKEDFAFLKTQETSQDLALAPFQFSYITRPTTYIPMLLFVAMNFSGGMEDGYERDSFSTSDAFYAGSLNYQAGLGEEAMFRGWAMPLARYHTGNDHWANAISTAAFTASHYPIHGTGGTPFWFASGLYFGYVTQKNDWSISEAIFIHTWTNFIATVAEFSTRQKKDKNAILWTPALRVLW